MINPVALKALAACATAEYAKRLGRHGYGHGGYRRAAPIQTTTEMCVRPRSQPTKVQSASIATSPNGDAFFTRYSIEHESGFTPVNLPGFGLFDDNLAQNLTLSYTHIFSPTMINNISFGMSRLSMHEYSENNNTNDYVSELGIQGVSWGGKGAWGMPYFNVQGYTPIGDSFSATPVQDWDTFLQLHDTWHRQIGRHSFKGRRRLFAILLAHVGLFPDPRLLSVHERFHDANRY